MNNTFYDEIRYHDPMVVLSGLRGSCSYLCDLLSHLLTIILKGDNITLYAYKWNKYLKYCILINKFIMTCTNSNCI